MRNRTRTLARGRAVLEGLVRPGASVRQELHGLRGRRRRVLHGLRFVEDDVLENRAVLR